MKNIFRLCGAGMAVALALGLGACSEDGVNDPGLTTTFTAIPVGAGALPAGDHDEDHHVTVTPQHEAPSYKTFRRADGTKIDLQLGLINLVPVGLQRCPTLAGRVDGFLDKIHPLATAQAHAGHDGGEAPAGAINVLAADGTPLDLGSLVVLPGQYCAVELALVPGGMQVQPKHGDGLDTSLDGVAVNVSPCYYPDTVGLSDADAALVTAHSCGQARVASTMRRFVVDFPAPRTLDAGQRQLDLQLLVRYQEWFDGVDLHALTHGTALGHAAAAEQLLGNIARAVHAVSEQEQPVALGFAFEVGGHEAVCGGIYDGLGSTAQPLRVDGYRFYASDFTLKSDTASVPVRLASRNDGTVYQDDRHNVALLGDAQGCDSPAPVRRLSLAGTVPRGDYEQICFTVGVPFELNHSNVATAPAPLDVTAMSWSWLSGRMFFRFDAKVGAGIVAGGPMQPMMDHGDGGDGGDPADIRNFFVHLGSTGCSNGAGQNGAPPDAACVAPNRPQVCLDYADIAAGAPIVVDVAPAISELDITFNTEGTAPGCMSGPTDPECTTIIPQFGLDFSPSVPRRDQTVFTVGEVAEHDHGSHSR